MVGQVLLGLRVGTDDALRDLQTWRAARPGRGMRRKWARVCAAIRARGEKQIVMDEDWCAGDFSLEFRLHYDLQALVAEAHLRACWLRGAV